MVHRQSLKGPLSDPNSLLVVGLVAGFSFLGAVATGYQGGLDALFRRTFTLSVVEWTAYTVGPLLVDPLLPFAVLYVVGVRRPVAVSSTSLLVGLCVAAAIGGFVGQLLAMRTWGPAATAPIRYVWYADVLAPDPRIAGLWVRVVEPIARDVLTAVAALGLAAARRR